MTSRGWAAGAALLLVLAPGAVHAAATEANFALRTTGDLVELCDPKSNSAIDNAAINFCQGFAMGAVSVEQEEYAASRSTRLFCLPSPAPSRTDTLNEFVRWARASPDRMNGLPADGLFRFLGEHFPCPTSR